MCYTDKKRRQCYTKLTRTPAHEKWQKLKLNNIPAQHAGGSSCWAAQLFTFTRRLNIPWAFSYSLCFCHILFLAAHSLLAILFQNGSSFQWLLGCHHTAGVSIDLNLLLKKRYRHHHHWEPRGTTYGSTDSALASIRHSCLPRERAGQPQTLAPRAAVPHTEEMLPTTI